MSDIDWMTVRDDQKKEVGAVGFIGDQAVAFASFFHEDDRDRDGEVSGREKAISFIPIFGRSTHLLEVATLGYGDLEIRMRDPQYGALFSQQFTRFATRLIIDGVYLAYFSRPVSGLAGATSRALVQGRVKQFAVKKGTEALVKQAFEKALGK